MKGGNQGKSPGPNQLCRLLIWVSIKIQLGVEEGWETGAVKSVEHCEDDNRMQRREIQT